MPDKFSIIIFIYLFIIPSLCFKIRDKFTSGEIAIPFKTLNEKDSVVFKTNIFGEEKNCSIDIISSEQILSISNGHFPDEKSLKNSEFLSIINQDGNIIEGYRKDVSIEFSGDKYRKGITINDIYSIITKTNDESKIHSLGFSHNIKEKNSIVHQLYNSGLITQRQFSILYSYPNWGTFSFGKEGTLVTNMQNIMLRQCSAVKGPYWGCHLSGIYIENVELPLDDQKIRENNKNIEVDQDTIFDIRIGDVLVTEEIFEFFYNNFFEQKLFSEKKCTMFENNQLKKIVCKGIEKNKNRNEFEKFSRVHFVFDDVVDIYVLGKYFFDDEKNFRIIYIKENKNIIIGKSVLSKYYMIYNYDEDKIKFFGMFGGRYLERKLDYDLKMKNKLVSNLEYYRYKIEKVNENIFPLFKFLFVLVSIGNLIIFYAFCKINKKRKENILLQKLGNTNLQS